MKTRNTGKAKGVNTSKGSNVYTDEEMGMYLLSLSKTIGRVPSARDIAEDKFGPSATSYYNRGPKSLKKWIINIFGSYKKYKPVKYTDEFLIMELQRFYKEFDKVPTFDSISIKDGYPCGAIYSRRGGFGKFLQQAGFAQNKIHTYTEDELILKIKKLSVEIGRVPSSGDLRVARLKNREYPELSAYFSRMSWAKWMEKAGMVSVFRYYTDKELEFYLLKASEQLGRTPTTEDIKELKGFPSRDVYLRRGSWSGWLKRCGLKKATRYVSKDGHITRSRDEAKIDDWLFDNGIAHGYEPKYLGDCRYRADFLVNDIYYEYCGLAAKFPGYDEKMKKKLEYAKQNGMKVVKIHRKDLNNLEKIFIKE